MTVDNGREIRDFKSIPSRVEVYVCMVLSYSDFLVYSMAASGPSVPGSLFPLPTSTFPCDLQRLRYL
jgi:hypothetical protein